MILCRDDVLARLAPRNLGLVFGCDVRRGDSRTVDEAEGHEESDTHRRRLSSAGCGRRNGGQ